MNRRRFTPTLQGLESRLALSTASASMVHIQAKKPRPFLLDGQMKGQFLIASDQVTQTFSGSGRLGVMGKVQVAEYGTVGASGFIGGEADLTNNKGTVHLTLTVDRRGLHYRIVSGTGAYANAQGSGDIGARGKLPSQTLTFKTRT